MSEPSLETLFERYRSAGDLEALGAVFDRTAPELLVLAAHLVRDPVEAEDLVQTTFVAAIEGARSFEGGRRLEPWLAGILARHAARVHRERARAPDPERLEREEGPDPLAHAERRELAAALEQGLAELSPPYREVLERYLHGEKPLAIARASGRAPGAVRMQILRALERLRRILPVGLYGVVPLARTPRGLAALRTEVIGHAAPAAVAAAAGASSLVGGLVVSTKLVLSVAALAAVLTVTFLVNGSREPSPPSLTVGATPVEAAEAPIEASASTTEPAASARTPAENDAAPATKSANHSRDSAVPDGRTGVYLVGHLLGLEGLDPDQVQIYIRTDLGGKTSAQGAADGRYAAEITNLSYAPSGTPTKLFVTATHPAGRRTSVEFPCGDALRAANHYELNELALDLDLSPRTAVIGRVELGGDVRESVELPEVRVGLIAGDDASTEGNCDADGNFTLFPAYGGDYRLAARAEGALPAVIDVHVAADEVLDVGTLRIADPGVAIDGRLVVPFAAEAHIQVGARRVGSDDGSNWSGIGFREGHPEIVDASAKVEPDGAFHIGGLEPGNFSVGLNNSFSIGPSSASIVLDSPTVSVTAPAKGVELGANLGRLKLTVRSRDGELDRVQLSVSRHGMNWGGVECGRPIEVIADRSRPLDLEASAPGWTTARAEFPAGTRPVDQELTLELERSGAFANLDLTWTLSDGQAPPSHVEADLCRGSERSSTIVRGGERGCRLENLVPGHYRVALQSSGENSMDPAPSFLCSTPFEVDLAAGESAHATVEWLVGGRARFVPDASLRPELKQLRARVLDAAGQELLVTFMQRHGDGMMSSNTGDVALREPSELQPTLAPGAYELVLSEKAEQALHVPFTIVAGQTIEVPFAVR